MRRTRFTATAPIRLPTAGILCVLLAAGLFLLVNQSFSSNLRAAGNFAASLVQSGTFSASSVQAPATFPSGRPNIEELQIQHTRYALVSNATFRLPAHVINDQTAYKKKKHLALPTGQPAPPDPLWRGVYCEKSVASLQKKSKTHEKFPYHPRSPCCLPSLAAYV